MLGFRSKGKSVTARPLLAPRPWQRRRLVRGMRPHTSMRAAIAPAHSSPMAVCAVEGTTTTGSWAMVPPRTEPPTLHGCESGLRIPAIGISSGDGHTCAMLDDGDMNAGGLGAAGNSVTIRTSPPRIDSPCSSMGHAGRRVTSPTPDVRGPPVHRTRVAIWDESDPGHLRHHRDADGNGGEYDLHGVGQHLRHVLQRPGLARGRSQRSEPLLCTCVLHLHEGHHRLHRSAEQHRW